MFQITMKLVGYQPPSTNKAYIPTANRRKGSRFAHAYFRKSDLLISWQEFVSRAFKSGNMISSDDKYKLKSYVINMNKGIEVYIKISIPKNIYYIDEDSEMIGQNDASNFIKPIEDSIFHHLGFDDRRTIKITSEKGFNEDGEWYAEINISEYELNNKIDINLKGAYYYE